MSVKTTATIQTWNRVCIRHKAACFVPQASRSLSKESQVIWNGHRRQILTASMFSALLSILSSKAWAEETVSENPVALKDFEMQITQKVVLEIGVCEDSIRINRTLGETRFCVDVAPLGKITLGLFGNRLPVTVSNFIKTVEQGSYDGTIVNKILPGEFVLIGKQGKKRNGEVEPPKDLDPNPELTTSKAFALGHSRPGTLSLAISQNEDANDRTLSKDYHPTQFLITTGPGPAFELDDGNVVFGRVLDGFDTLSLIAEQRTYKPSSRIQAFNAFATAIGDERAAEAKKNWGRPIQPVVVISARVVSSTMT